MTELLEKAVATARTLPPKMQDEIARMVLMYAGDGEPAIRLTPEEEVDLFEAQAEMARGEFASDEEVRAVFAKYRG